MCQDFLLTEISVNFLLTYQYTKQAVALNLVIPKEESAKGPVKIIKRVKIAYSFLQSVSDQFHVIIFSLLA